MVNRDHPWSAHTLVALLFSCAFVLDKSYASRLHQERFSNLSDLGKELNGNKKSISPLNVVDKLERLSNKSEEMDLEEKRVKYGGKSSEEEIYGLSNKFANMDLKRWKKTAWPVRRQPNHKRRKET